MACVWGCPNSALISDEHRCCKYHCRYVPNKNTRCPERPLTKKTAQLHWDPTRPSRKHKPHNQNKVQPRVAHVTWAGLPPTQACMACLGDTPISAKPSDDHRRSKYQCREMPNKKHYCKTNVQRPNIQKQIMRRLNLGETAALTKTHLSCTTNTSLRHKCS